MKTNNDLRPFVWGGLGEKKSNGGTQWFYQDRAYEINAVSPAVLASLAPWFGAEREYMEKKKLRIRKLTEGECYRLMGFEEKDTEACKAAGQSKSNIYHQAGDSIVTTVLCGIFGTLLGLDYEKAIENHSDKLHNECV